MAAFAREADVFLRELRTRRAECMASADDEGVRETASTIKLVERAACVHSAARTLAYVRPAHTTQAHERSETTATKVYLEGVQLRLAKALVTRNVWALEELCDAADAAMDRMAARDNAGTIGEMAENAANFERTALEAGRRAACDEELVKKLAATSGYGGERPAWRGTMLRALHLVVVCVAIIGVAFITRRYAVGIFYPSGFVRLEAASAAPHILTFCLSASGVPHSRIALYNGSGETFRYPQAERYWDNPASEACAATYGLSYPFPLNSLKVHRETQCRPCWRLHGVHNNSKLLVAVDVDAIQCLRRPGGPTTQAVRAMRSVVKHNLNKVSAVLRVPSGQLVRGAIDLLSAQQLCNALYFGVLPLAAGAPHAGSGISRYTFDGERKRWAYTGTNGSEYQLRPPKSMQDVDHTVRVRVAGGEDKGALLEPPSYGVLTLRQSMHYGTARVSTEFNALRTTEVNGTALERWHIGRLQLTVAPTAERYYRGVVYTAWQYAIDLVSYAALIFGSILFTRTMSEGGSNKEDGAARRNESAVEHILRRHRAHFASKEGH